jgi:hypothetical protein
MSFPSGLFITNLGKVLQAKVLAGATLTFTKMKMGDGSLSGQLPTEMTALVSFKNDVAITRLERQATNKTLVGGYYSNTGLVTGFYFKEWGVYATDPDVGEILYCYGNADTAAEYIPAASSSVIEKYLNAVMTVNDASTVTATINNSLVYALDSELTKIKYRMYMGV